MATSDDKLKNVSYSFSKQHGVCLDPEVNVLHFNEKMPIEVLAELQRSLPSTPDIAITEKDDFVKILQKQQEANASGAMRDIEGIDEVLDLNSLISDLNEPDDILESSNDAPVITLLNALITEAVREHASDIHIEQYEDRLRIRFRVDGALQEVLEPDSKLAPLIISRIKVMAKLDISEKRLPQDGRISVKIGGRPVDVRVSTIPTGTGFEKVVMRLLNKDAGSLDLDSVGMPPNIRKMIDQVIEKPHGIMLVTGPTGSGKTTTLYSILGKLNKKESNIMTVEDPVEYYIDGINQSQVNAKIGMTFAAGLRSILRQDPDIVMIGEIRDSETSEIAIQASLTGHLVFSTLHTNTAIGAITRLKDMGVEPFLLASSLNGVLAQRLVRTLCSCKKPKESDIAENAILKLTDSVTIYEAGGCEKCKFSGYKGRKGVFDFVMVDEQIKLLIHNGGSEKEMTRHARQFSYSLLDTTIRLVLSGDTSLDELIRVTGSGED